MKNIRKILGLLIATAMTTALSMPVCAAELVINKEYIDTMIPTKKEIKAMKGAKDRTKDMDKILKKVSKTNTRENLLKKHSSYGYELSVYYSDGQKLTVSAYSTAEGSALYDNGNSYYLSDGVGFVSRGSNNNRYYVYNETMDKYVSEPLVSFGLEDTKYHCCYELNGEIWIYSSGTFDNSVFPGYYCENIEIFDAKTYEMNWYFAFAAPDKNTELSLICIGQTSYDEPMDFTYFALKALFERKADKMVNVIQTTDPGTETEEVRKMTIPANSAVSNFFPSDGYAGYADSEGKEPSHENSWDQQSDFEIYMIKKEEQA